MGCLLQNISTGRVIGAASLILEEPYRKAGKGRFMIFHSETSQVGAYRSLLNFISGMISEVDQVYLFVSPGRPVQKILEEIGFSIERYSFVLKGGLEHVSLDIPKEINSQISRLTFVDRHTVVLSTRPSLKLQVT